MDPSSGPTTLEYQYDPLNFNRSNIRLVRLLKGNFGDDVSCEMFEAWLDLTDVAEYEALSYTWGNPSVRTRISINDRYLEVTVSVEQALRHLRDPNRDRVFWIDAICINQTDPKERGHQVRRMRHIYQLADRVVIWLGMPGEGSDELMEYLARAEYSSIRVAGEAPLPPPRLPEERKERMLDRESRQRVGNALRELLDRRWFTRVWILQEVASAREAVVVCGTKFVPARVFSMAPPLLGIQPDVHCQAVLDIMPGRSRGTSWWSRRRDLLTLLVRFRLSEATDPRDKIYALLGMASDACDSEVLRPDYTKPLAEVIDDTSAFVLSFKYFESLGNKTYSPSSLHNPPAIPDWAIWVFKIESQETLSQPIHLLITDISFYATTQRGFTMPHGDQTEREFTFPKYSMTRPVVIHNGGGKIYDSVISHEAMHIGKWR